MGIANPKFQDVGHVPGEAAHWTMRAWVAAERVAGFGPAPYRAWEDFERWSKVMEAFAPGSLVIGLFAPKAQGGEDFEGGWGNEVFVRELPSGEVVAAVFGGAGNEPFESGWGNDRFMRWWSDVDAVSGAFGEQGPEDFEAGAGAFAWSWEGVSSVMGVFEQETVTVEGFESGWLPPNVS